MKFKTQAEFDTHVAEIVGKQMAEQLAPFQKRQDDFGNMFKMMGGMSRPGSESSPGGKGMAVARIARSLAAMKGDPWNAAKWAERHFQDEQGEEISKALAAGDAAAGGFMVPEQYSTDLIEFYRPMTVVRRAQPMILPMPTGTTSVPRVTGGSSANYIGENSNIGATGNTFGQVVLTWKKLAAIVPISNDLLRFSSPSADTVVRDDLALAMSTREDLAFIRGDGLSGTPKGLKNWIQPVNSITANVTVNLQNVVTDLESLVTALENANVKMIKPAWFFSPRSKNYLMTVQTSTGAFAFRDEMLKGELWGWPYFTTTQIPTNLGSGADTEVYFTDFTDAVIGEATTLIIDASNEAAYYDGTNVVAAFSLDQTVIRAIAQHDFAMRHDLAAAMLTGVKW